MQERARDEERHIPVWVGYAVALLVEFALTVALDLLRPVFPGVLVLIPYILVTMGVAYYFGTGPAALSVLLAMFGQTYVYIQPIHHFWPFGQTHGEMTRFWFLVAGMVAAGWAMLSVRKLTHRLRAEAVRREETVRALRQAEHDLNRAQAIARIGSWRLNVGTNELIWSDEAYRMFGVPEGTTLTYEAFLASVHPDDREYVDRRWNDALRGEPYDIAHRIIADDGKVKWVRETAELEFDERGDLVSGFGTVQEVTEAMLLRNELSRSLDEAQHDRERIGAIESLTEVGISTQGLEETLSLVAVRIRDGLRAHSSTLFLLDEQSDELVAKAASDTPEIIGVRVRRCECFLWRVYSERAPAYIRDLEHEPLASIPQVEAAGAKSVLGVPLIGRSGVLGVAYVDTEEIREFGPDEVRLLQTMAARTALIIENARLVAQTTDNFQLLQRALLPPEPPEVRGYGVVSRYLPGVAGAEIGGDFYDVFETEAGLLGAIIGDVTGKGIPSASLAAATRSTLRAFVYDTSAPGESITHANSVLTSEVRDEMLFVTALAAVADRKTGQVFYANAGHPPPAVYHRAAHYVEFLQFGDPPVGVLKGYEFRGMEARLHPGDKIILYTDGLTEARRGDDMFGQEGIERVLTEHGHESPESVVEALVSAACVWAQGHLQDDTAVIVVECEREE